MNAMKIFFPLLVVVFITGCSCEPTGYENKTYACQSDADCISGFHCVDAVCSTATPDSGSGGGSAGGGAGGGGGGGSMACADRQEVCGDDIDQNCNGILDDGCACTVGLPCYPDQFGVFGHSSSTPELGYPWDGGVGCSPGLQPCTDGRLGQTCLDVHVPANEVCDGKDNDCDGVIDLPTCTCQSGRACYFGAQFTNGIGVCHPGVYDCTAGTTCAGANVGGVESCNGLDDDCNGSIDDGELGLGPCAPGMCSSSFRKCVNGLEAACDLTMIPGYSVTEVCGDQQDNNCDGQVDEGCACDAGSSQGCFTGPASACDGGACFGICRLGAQLCAATGDGGIGFGSCMNQVLPATELCSDGVDNDCDQQTDCADTQCSGRSCSAQGKTCSSGTCKCIFDGGVSTVEICNDVVDNTCDSLADCQQSTCANQVCGANGKKCVGTTCTCVVDGGVSQAAEAACSDLLDNDCDGLFDCADTTCANQVCATGKTCQQNVCTCLTDGGTPQTTEISCADNVDNDCDGLVDCADPNCAASCTTPENCKDGIDNDGDTLRDCDDPDCQHKACDSASAGSFCCGTACKNLGTDPLNCGGCGAVCPSGACSPVGGTKPSGVCTCNVDAGCPRTGPTAQTCSANLCTCGDDNDRCNRTAGQTCDLTNCVY
jgi:Putative metal-binding motif